MKKSLVKKLLLTGAIAILIGIGYAASFPESLPFEIGIKSLISNDTTMKKTKVTESQIISILNQLERGLPLTDICREHGISTGTFHNWKAKYGVLNINQLKRLKEMEEENARLKKMYADLSPVHDAFKDAVEKKH